MLITDVAMEITGVVARLQTENRPPPAQQHVPSFSDVAEQGMLLAKVDGTFAFERLQTQWVSTH